MDEFFLNINCWEIRNWS